MAGTGRDDQARELKAVRNGVYASFVKWADALFELADALLCFLASHFTSTPS